MQLEFKLVLNAAVTSGANQYKINCIVNSVDVCPLCHTASVALPVFEDLRYLSQSYILHTFYICPACGNAYFAKYKSNYIDKNEVDFGNAIRVQPRKTTIQSFSDDVVKLSPDFVAVYNEASQVEQHGLEKICGAGYRRAFEYLLKDYLISQYPDKSEQIADAQMYDIINDKNKEYNMPLKIVEIAKRCAWLGNDHSHYRVKHTNADLEDLKAAIDILYYWIMTEFKSSDILKRIKKK